MGNNPVFKFDSLRAIQQILYSSQSSWQADSPTDVETVAKLKLDDRLKELRGIQHDKPASNPPR